MRYGIISLVNKNKIKMKKEIDSHFAIAVVALVAACLGVAFALIHFS